jgi:hypothetical protein
VGSLDRDPAFADGVLRRARDNGLRDRVQFAGPRTGSELDRAYAAADLLVLASHAETYGMVVTEALARGLPVLATDVGGVSEALGDGTPPALLVPPGDPAALGRGLAAVHVIGAAAFGATAPGTPEPGEAPGGTAPRTPELQRASAPPLRIGPLTLPNEPLADWASFYAERRLRPLLRLAADRGALPAAGVAAVERAGTAPLRALAT